MKNDTEPKHSDLAQALKDGAKYWLGPVIRVHRFAEFQILEYKEICFATGSNYKKPTGKSGFSIFINESSIGQGCETLEGSIVHAIAYKYDGCSSRAASYFMKMMGDETHKDYLLYAGKDTRQPTPA